MKEKLYRVLPHFLQEFLVYLYNRKAYKVRHGGKYRSYREEKKRNRGLTLDELKSYQRERFRDLIDYAIDRSSFYNETLGCIERANDITNISKLPIVTKDILRHNIDSIVTISSAEGVEAKTGGTTGKSLQVMFTEDNMQERFALLDDFRNRFGYELGAKTAWFSGKDLLSQSDINKNRFWKTDRIHKIRFYSTFHIKQAYLKHYVEDLIKYQPEYLVGFPSTISEIASFGLRNGYTFPADTVKAAFPTAETITSEIRSNIESFFKTKVYDQYASSEGAPFIFECERGSLHLELQSGVFEVLDETGMPAKSGRLVVTSFTNYGTPLIRYDIGDSLTLASEDDNCTCGNNNPLVKALLGRSDDFIYSPENGKINIVNIANAVKDVHGVINYKVVQDSLDEITLQILIDKEVYTQADEHRFIRNWKDRIGSKMKIKVDYVDRFDVANSGKFRVVENNIKHLIKNTIISPVDGLNASLG